MIASGVKLSRSAFKTLLTIEGEKPDTSATPRSSYLTGTLSAAFRFQNTILGIAGIGYSLFSATKNFFFPQKQEAAEANNVKPVEPNKFFIPSIVTAGAFAAFTATTKAISALFASEQSQNVVQPEVIESADMKPAQLIEEVKKPSGFFSKIGSAFSGVKNYFSAPVNTDEMFKI